MALSANVSSWNLRLKGICQAGDPTGTNHTLVNTKSFLGCASACDFNPRCYFLSFNGTDCVMYEDVSPCNGTNGGPTREVYQVEPRCELGWHRFGGSCYIVLQGPLINALYTYSECPHRGASMVAINNAREGVFLTELFYSLNMYDTTVWTGGWFSDGNWGWWGSPEPMVYQNWKVDVHQTGDNCMAVNSTDGKWQSRMCSDGMSCVCEKPLF